MTRLDALRTFVGLAAGAIGLRGLEPDRPIIGASYVKIRPNLTEFGRRDLEVLRQQQRRIAGIARAQRAKQLEETRRQTALLHKIHTQQVQARFRIRLLCDAFKSGQLSFGEFQSALIDVLAKAGVPRDRARRELGIRA